MFDPGPVIRVVLAIVLLSTISVAQPARKKSEAEFLVPPQGGAFQMGADLLPRSKRDRFRGVGGDASVRIDRERIASAA